MQPELIAKHLRQQPFVPFRLLLQGGKTQEVRDPRWFRVFPDRLQIAFPDPELPYPAIDGYETIPLVEIEAMEQVTEAA